MPEQERNDSSHQREALTNEELWLVYRIERDDDYWETLYHRLRPPVYGLIRRILDDVEQAEDLTQETMVRVLTSNFDARQGKLLSFALTIGRNLALDELRRRRGRDMISTNKPQSDDEDEPLGATLPDTLTPWPDAVVLSHEQTQALRYYFGCLSDTEQKVLMEWLDEIPQKEIAKSLGLAYGTVRNCLGRALKKLRQCYEHYEGRQSL